MFSVYVFVFSFCHVVPPSKLYVSVAFNPDCVSAAPFTVNVTLFFVHSVVFPVTLVIVGTVLSILVISLEFTANSSSKTELYNLTDIVVFSVISVITFPDNQLLLPFLYWISYPSGTFS